LGEVNFRDRGWENRKGEILTESSEEYRDVIWWSERNEESRVLLAVMKGNVEKKEVRIQEEVN